MANQPPTGRGWLFRLASQTRMEPPPPPQPQPQPAPPPRSALPIRQASLALGRTSFVPPPPTQPAALPQTTTTAPPPPPPRPQPPPAPETPRPTPPRATNGPAITSVEAPRPVAAPTTQPPPSPRPVAVVPPPQRPASPRPVATPPPQLPAPPRPVAAPRSSPTPPQSPKVVAATSRSPSFSFTQPSAAPTSPHPEPEPKRTVEKDNAKQNGTKLVSSNGVGETHKKNSHYSNHNDSSKKAFSPSPKNEEKKKDEKEIMKVITIAGHNVGAFMDLGSSYSHQTRKLQLHRAQVESQVEEDINNSKGETYTEGSATKAAATEKKKPWFSLVNSNVQSVNNSLLLDSSCTQGSAGVHINLNSKPLLKNSKSSTQMDHPSLH